MAKIVRLIYTEERTGKGKDGDPVRMVKQWFREDGTLEFQIDTYTGETNIVKVHPATEETQVAENDTRKPVPPKPRSRKEGIQPKPL